MSVFDDPVAALNRRQAVRDTHAQNSTRQATSLQKVTTTGYGEIHVEERLDFDASFVEEPSVSYGHAVNTAATPLVDGFFPRVSGGVEAWDQDAQGNYTGAFVYVVVDTAQVPYAVLTGLQSVTVANGTASTTVPITFPAGYFTVAPTMSLVNAGGTGSSAMILQTVGVATTAGFSLLVEHKDLGATAAVTTTVNVQWTAIQLTGTPVSYEIDHFFAFTATATKAIPVHLLEDDDDGIA